MAEDLSAYMNEQGYQAAYLHSSIKPMERLQILRSLRKGSIDVIVGVNLLREGLNLPEVSLVVILDADKEGFLRSDTALIQVKLCTHTADRKSVVEGKSVSVSVDLGGRRIIKKKNKKKI